MAHVKCIKEIFAESCFRPPLPIVQQYKRKYKKPIRFAKGQINRNGFYQPVSQKPYCQLITEKIFKKHERKQDCPPFSKDESHGKTDCRQRVKMLFILFLSSKYKRDAEYSQSQTLAVLFRSFI